jgi:REP element-mobilizing transposase RayT
MPQSLAKVYVHLVFSTKNRESLLRESVHADLHAYLGGILRDLDSPAIEINSEPDHIHVLFVLSRTRALSDVVGQLKSGSSTWLKTKGAVFNAFHWQNGYGAFSVSQSSVEEVREYIRRQQDHHKRTSFQDEFRAFLRRYAIEFDERYVWD